MLMTSLFLLLPFLATLLGPCSVKAMSSIAVAGFRPGYIHQHNGTSVALSPVELIERLEADPRENRHPLYRFASPESIFHTFDGCRRIRRGRSFSFFQGKDGRVGNVSSTPLGSDWILAESQQIVVHCTPTDVLRAYLSGDLQTKWNANTVLECKITEIQPPPTAAELKPQKNKRTPARTTKKQRRAGQWGATVQQSVQKDTSATSGAASEPHYQQDLVLKSQRIIRTTTGIMQYSQTICIDQIGGQPQHDTTSTAVATPKYVVRVQLLPDAPQTTDRKPFEALSVYVHLEQQGPHVHVYAAGLMKVNRRVIPQILGFDASGIAGGMAGKGTLWLAAHFQQQYDASLRQPQKQTTNPQAVGA